MAFQPVEATALVELVQDYYGSTIENTLYFRQSNDFVLADLVALSTALKTWWVTEMAPNLSASLSLQRVVATALHDQTGPQFINTAGLPELGGQGANGSPNGVALVVSLRTALIGRAFRGRNYVAGIIDEEVISSLVTADRAEAVRFGYEQISTYLPAGTSHVIVTRTVNGVVQEPSALTNTVLSYVIVTRATRSQRRRNPGIGT